MALLTGNTYLHPAVWRFAALFVAPAPLLPVRAPLLMLLLISFPALFAILAAVTLHGLVVAAIVSVLADITVSALLLAFLFLLVPILFPVPLPVPIPLLVPLLIPVLMPFLILFLLPLLIPVLVLVFILLLMPVLIPVLILLFIFPLIPLHLPVLATPLLSLGTSVSLMGIPGPTFITFISAVPVTPVLAVSGITCHPLLLRLPLPQSALPLLLLLLLLRFLQCLLPTALFLGFCLLLRLFAGFACLLLLLFCLVLSLLACLTGFDTGLQAFLLCLSLFLQFLLLRLCCCLLDPPLLFFLGLLAGFLLLPLLPLTLQALLLLSLLPLFLLLLLGKGRLLLPLDALPQLVLLLLLLACRFLGPNTADALLAPQLQRHLFRFLRERRPCGGRSSLGLPFFSQLSLQLLCLPLQLLLLLLLLPLLPCLSLHPLALLTLGLLQEVVHKVLLPTEAAESTFEDLRPLTCLGLQQVSLLLLLLQLPLHLLRPLLQICSTFDRLRRRLGLGGWSLWGRRGATLVRGSGVCGVQ
mmetsp:Transcript_42529/g.76333  ORF Transcript_42529/g.76333 Transcript_42529/m.76333 type:complete len:526 (-) Transcript_42529:1536-3113(-)